MNSHHGNIRDETVLKFVSESVFRPDWKPWNTDIWEASSLSNSSLPSSLFSLL